MLSCDILFSSTLPSCIASCLSQGNHIVVKTYRNLTLPYFLPAATAGVEKEATIVNTYESSVSYNMTADRLLDGKGLDGNLSSGWGTEVTAAPQNLIKFFSITEDVRIHKAIHWSGSRLNYKSLKNLPVSRLQIGLIMLRSTRDEIMMSVSLLVPQKPMIQMSHYAYQ